MGLFKVQIQSFLLEKNLIWHNEPKEHSKIPLKGKFSRDGRNYRGVVARLMAMVECSVELMDDERFVTMDKGEGPQEDLTLSRNKINRRMWSTNARANHFPVVFIYFYFVKTVHITNTLKKR